MRTADLWAEIEKDLAWRVDELRFFRNGLGSIHFESDQERFRRALVLLLYAHFEGFCKFALTLYVNAVNRSGISCAQANFAIAAASLSDLFKALRNPQKKIPEFRRGLPDDTKLHRFGREREFVERTSDFAGRPVLIRDDVVDTESNLNPTVLRKNLYRLGFAHDRFTAQESSINQLLEYRNKIAHGQMRAGLKADKFEELNTSALAVMEEIKREVMAAIENKSYLRVSGQSSFNV
jgi:hypothetical protein